MHVTHYMPYVGIKATEMIEKLHLDFIFSGDSLTAIDTLTGEHHAANEYEKKLFFQSQMEKFIHTGRKYE